MFRLAVRIPLVFAFLIAVAAPSWVSSPEAAGPESNAASTDDGSRFAPPLTGAVYADPDIIVASDPSSLTGISYGGTAQRRAYYWPSRRDRSYTGYQYTLRFDDGDSLIVSVDTGVGSEQQGRREVDKIATAIGQVPALMRRGVSIITVWNGDGRGTATPGVANISTYSSANDENIRLGYVEEFFVHESSHLSVDRTYYGNRDYRRARGADPEFISTYARDNPNTEDIAETMVPYIAVRYYPDRISPDLKRQIERAIPNRLAFFNSQNLDFYPVGSTGQPGRGPETTPDPGPAPDPEPTPDAPPPRSAGWGCSRGR